MYYIYNMSKKPKNKVSNKVANPERLITVRLKSFHLQYLDEIADDIDDPMASISKLVRHCIEHTWHNPK